MMTRKDYVATAEIIKTYANDMPVAVVEAMVEDFIEMFATDNEKFDSDWFWEACFEGTRHA